MRYWVYINDKVDGPYDEDKLAVLDGFTPDTLICSEEIEEGGSQEWVKASSVFEFDEATKTMTRAPLTQEELDTVRGNTADVTATSPITQVPASVDTSTTKILIDKIDLLTREIESLKTKLDAALAAGISTPKAEHTAPVAAAEKTATVPHQPEPVTEEAAITNTESLVNHAEQLVAQASANTTNKPVDFLDEIQIGSSKTENLAEKGGEEVVLRSALDSLYNTKPVEQPEEEKEATFQDLLSSAKVITEQSIPAAAEKTAPTLQAAPAEEEPKVQEPQPQEKPEPVALHITPEEQPVATPISEEKREEIINEITAPAQQDNLILQAISDAQKEEGLKLAEDKAPAEEPAHETQPSIDISHETAKQEQPADLPSLAEEATPAPAQEESKEKESLDLSDQPQLSIVNEEAAEQPAAQQLQQEPAQAAQNIPSVSDELTPMDPTEEQNKAQQEVTETIKELVPGKKVEAQEEGDGLISQADLDEAFTEHNTPASDFPIPQEEQPAAEKEEEVVAPMEQTSSLPEGKGFYNPNDMTEVELKEGSTYLISDFIPPAQANPSTNAIPKAYGAVPGSAEAAQTEAENKEKPSTVQVQPLNEAVEEIVPSQTPNQADLTMSKVVLENTIKTKRGATMDIKTVPMVHEPADSNRLDLSESDLADINAQHDLKAADVKPGNKKLTKMVFGTLASVVILILIYVMLAYLELLPAQFNFIKSQTPAASQMQDEQLNEMLGTQPDTPALPNTQPTQQSAMQQPGYVPNAQGQMQPGALPAQQGQMMPGQMGQMQPGQNPNAMMDAILTEVKNFPMVNGQTLEQLINSRHPAAQNLIEWTITTAVEPDNYSILVKVPPENPQSFKIPYRFNYNTVTKTLEPTISDSKNLLDSLKAPQAAQ